MNRKIGISLACLIGLSLLVATPAHAQRRRGVHPIHRGGFVFVGGYFYDPFYGPYPWWDPMLYPYGYRPIYDDSASVRIEVTPKDAAVYLDGYYAGIVDDFDGFFQRLTVPPGPHELTLYLEGYRTVRQQLQLAPQSTYKARYQMARLAAGETSEKPTIAPAVPPPPPGSYMPPRTLPRGPVSRPPLPGPPPDRGAPPIAGPASPTSSGTIVVRVQPGGADVLIDGERWASSDADRLLVQVSAGRHRVEIRKAGYRPLTVDVDVRAGAMMPLNVSLSPE